ncbi:MAG: hypothetical protein NC131_16100 [Roseburia sp.]|nr:hypothetical protein [Roseburia sp.]
MENINFLTLSDDQLISCYGELYTIYAEKQRERLPKKVGTDVSSTNAFKSRHTYVDEFVINRNEFMYKLCLEKNDKGYINMGLATIMLNYEYICSYIKSQVIAVSAYSSIVSGLVSDYDCIDTYPYAIMNAEEIGLGFDKIKFLTCAGSTFGDEVSASQLVSVLNKIDSVFSKLVTWNIAGRTNVGKLDAETKNKTALLRTYPELMVRMCVYYNEHEPSVRYMMRNIGKYKIV